MRSRNSLRTLLLAAWAGPPFQTDDPQPIDFRHYEFYTFASSDGTRVEIDTEGPALEFNFSIEQSQPRASRDRPASVRHWRYRTGHQILICAGDKKRPMIGTFVMFEMPSGNAARGLGVGKTWYKLPIWVQKSSGP
jgi:hypothetical protein